MLLQEQWFVGDIQPNTLHLGHFLDFGLYKPLAHRAVLERVKVARKPLGTSEWFTVHVIW